MEITFGDNWVILWPLAFVVLAILLIRMRLRKLNVFYLFVFLVFSIYILFVIDITIFPIHITDHNHGEFFHPYAGINLVPFYFGRAAIPSAIKYQIVANVLLTIPFGFGLNFVSKVKARTFLWLPIAVGLGIELGQFMISLILGYLYRVVDINDVILNALGVIIGYGMFRIFRWMFLVLFNRLKFSQVGVTGYLYSVMKPRK